MKIKNWNKREKNFNCFQFPEYILIVFRYVALFWCTTILVLLPVVTDHQKLAEWLTMFRGKLQ